MVFSSVVFLCFFLPVFLGIYYLTPNRWRSLVILLGSYLFYAWWRVDFVILFGIVTFFSYWISVRILRAKASGNLHKAKQWLTLGIVGDLGVLAYFKYFNFGLEAFNSLILAMGGTEWDAWSVILPIGISFYIFQAISYLIDIYRGDAELAPSFLDFAAFIALFPQLIAGPVIRYKDIAYQFQQREHSFKQFNEGAIYFMAGFCKKVLIADSLAPLADIMFAAESPNFIESWLGILAYAGQLYFDFCGYSQMAVGLGLMMGFRFIRNFNHPYISRSITEFWQRWHISLSTWLRDYLYIPLGGNRKGKVRTYINLFLTMLLGGFWHGANWTFLLWGAWHGGILAMERMLGGKHGTPYPRFAAWGITFLAVLVGWVLFRAPDVTTALQFYQGMFTMPALWEVSDQFAWQITPLMLSTLAIAYLISFLSPYYLRKRGYVQDSILESWAEKLSLWEQLLLIGLFILAFCKLIAQSHSPFLYFQF
jgi:alginate O-acetyltransferase complex protein AlgI